jgi:hypothetical protein
VDLARLLIPLLPQPFPPSNLPLSPYLVSSMNNFEPIAAFFPKQLLTTGTTSWIIKVDF